ncbi:Imm48 family immunity protein [Fervidibacillus albus]|uniref:Imm48 family immunity protein n=1 Tax=Fervidibacillus albus TaxID=2980026 RepID=A0A9E8LUB2_9BACI|nr:Imm48 family immunity protein [Fervidibacillus albus]WAA08949.1 Imm48 family immunity protein [Fervidibacillus albus]
MTQFSEAEIQQIKEVHKEIEDIAYDLFLLSETQLEETAGLELLVFATFCFGIINEIALMKKLSSIQTYVITSLLLLTVFHYSEDQIDEIVQELFNTKDEHHPSLMYEITQRGMLGYHQYINDDLNDLKENLLDALAVAKEKGEEVI